MRLTIVIDVLGVEVDPTRTDPHEIAEDILDFYEAESRAGNAAFEVGFVSAEWDTA